MSLIKCKQCQKEINSNVKFCPNCGTSNIEQVYIPQNQSSKGEKYDISLVALICSFLVPLAGLVLGIIGMNYNKGLKNDARTFSTIAVIVSSIELVLTILVFIFYLFIVFATYSLY